LSDADARASAAARRWLLAVLVVGVLLRAWRLFDAGFESDEYFELMARRMIAETGAPTMPSGVFWIYGGPLLWVGAPMQWIAPLSVFVERLPFFLIGSAGIFVVARTARRLFGEWAAVAAAAAVAFHPGLVEWTANVKIYGALTTLTALAVDRYCAWVFEDDERGAWPFAAWFALASSCHPGVAFLAPPLALTAILVRGPRWCLRPRALGAAALAAAGGLGLYVAIRLGDPTMAQVMVADGPAPASAHPFIDAAKQFLRSLGSHGWRSSWHAVPFCVAAAGAAWGLRALLRPEVRASARTCPGVRRLALFGAWFLAFALFIELSRFGGAQYILPAYPLLALAAASCVGAIVDRTSRAGAVAALALLAAHVVAAGPEFRRVFAQRNEANARIYGRLAADARPGDKTFGFGVAAPLHAGFGVSDHIVYGRNFGLIALFRDGRPYDRVFGEPLLRTVDEVRPVLEKAPRAFYLVNAKELNPDPSRNRVTPEVHEWLSSRMELVLEEGGMRLYETR
jgi:4-amino-4-deoxy-L-arabinose transferase-like glycosyltransferase